LRNIALTAPYMHDGSITTLEKTVDHEIYYHRLSAGHPVNLTQADRQAPVAFLGTFTDALPEPAAR
jgi:cytochrome c peroxidase